MISSKDLIKQGPKNKPRITNLDAQYLYENTDVKNLLHDPERYQPLGSVKGYRNQPSQEQFIDLNLEELFLSAANISLCSKRLFGLYRESGGRGKRDDFDLIIPKMMFKFCEENDCNAYKLADEDSTEIRDYTALLRTINADLVKQVSDKFRANVFNPFRASITVGSTGNRVQKKMSDLLAVDIPTIDIWADNETTVYNSKFRDNNQIPVYRTSIHTRNYDRANEGLNNQDMESLETPIYAYDMSKVQESLDKWKKEDWFGL
jgi:hypothetical protein